MTALLSGEMRDTAELGFLSRNTANWYLPRASRAHMFRRCFIPTTPYYNDLNPTSYFPHKHDVVDTPIDAASWIHTLGRTYPHAPCALYPEHATMCPTRYASSRAPYTMSQRRESRGPDGGVVFSAAGVPS